MIDYTNASGTGLFDLLGKLFYAAQTLDTARGTTVPKEVTDAMQQFKLRAGMAMSYDIAMSGLPPSSESWQSSGDGLFYGMKAAAQNLLVEFCKSDSGRASMSVGEALTYLHDQMRSTARYVSPSNLNAWVTPAAGNYGDPEILVSYRRGDGRQQDLAYHEALTVKSTATDRSTSASLVVTSPPAVQVSSHNWPKGSGVQTYLAPTAPASIVANGGFDTWTVEDIPDSWICTEGISNGVIAETDVEVQRVTIAGTPTGGYYLLLWAGADGITRTTTSLAYNADAATVQAALRGILGLESITVASTGTAPNYAHVVTFTGVAGNINPLTYVSQLTGGAPTITITSLVDGSSGAYRGQALELYSTTGKAAATLYQPLTLTPDTVYFLCARMRTAAAGENESSSSSSSSSSASSNSSSSSSKSSATSSSSSSSCSSKSVSTSSSSSSKSSATSSSSSSCSSRSSQSSASSNSSSSSSSSSATSSSSSSSSSNSSSSCSSSESLVNVSSSSSSSSWSSSSSHMAQSIRIEFVNSIGGQPISDAAGTPCRMTVNTQVLPSASHRAKWFSFRIPSTIRQPVYLRLWWWQPMPAGQRLYIDDVMILPATELYAGGPYMAVAAGVTPMAPTDAWTVNISNDRAGKMQTWFERFFDLSSARMLLPTTGTYLLSDSLIA